MRKLPTYLILLGLIGTLFLSVLLPLPIQAQPTPNSLSNPIHSGVTVVQTLSNGLQEPQTILDILKRANNIPSEIAPNIKIQASPVLNAATDGQGVVITDSLLNRLNTNDERAFVISHELSHILLNHIAKTQVRHVGLSLLNSLLQRKGLSQDSVAGIATNLGFSLYDKRSSRVYEYQADDAGIQLMRKAGYNPQAALKVFAVLKAATPGGRTPEFLQSHPIPDSRIHALVKKYSFSVNEVP